MSDEGSDAGSNNEDEFDPKVRWVIPQRLDFMTFVGRDVFAVAHDVYITFINFRTSTEMVYVANSETTGDGVDVITGYKSYIFAFAEKVKHARIFIMMYPSFNILAELRDTDVNRYKGLCMMEGDLVAGFSGFPDYLVSVWSWRSGQRLLSLPTGVVRRKQMYMSSRTHTSVCECWGEGLIVWEVAQCYRRCLMMRRAKEEVTGWEVSSPPLTAICWLSDGSLYAVDPHAHLYSVVSDGINMVLHSEWTEEVAGTSNPCMCSFGNGILLYGPDNNLRWLKKAEAKWVVAWKTSMPDEVLRLVSSSSSDTAVAWTETGLAYRLTSEEEQPELKLFAFKQRNIRRIQMIAPDFKYVATISTASVLCIYDLMTSQLVQMKYIEGEDITFKASPVEPVLAVFGAAGAAEAGEGGGRSGHYHNYGLALFKLQPDASLEKVSSMCLTHQIVSRAVFSPTGRELMAAAMAAGHVFIFKVSEDHKLTLVRYAEIGRGLSDCFLMRVGDAMRAFSLVLFSDKYAIGERIVCINAETGKDNKFAGKMQGPYSKLLPLSVKDTMLAIPHLSKQFHILKLNGDKGVTVSVKMGPVLDSGHELRQFNGFYNANALLTFGADGVVVLRQPDGSPEYEMKVTVSHRYEAGVRLAVTDARARCVVHVGGNRTLAVLSTRAAPRPPPPPAPPAPPPGLLHRHTNTLSLFADTERNYLEVQEEKKVREETLDYRKQRDEVVKTFGVLRAKLVELLEENIAERPLHRLSLSEFNLHLENKKERLKQAEKERDEIRLQTEALIRAQDKVTAWIKGYCWDRMLTPRVKIFAIFSHYQVENYPVLPTQRDLWPELQQTEALRSVEMDNDADLFRPWEEQGDTTPVDTRGARGSSSASVQERRGSRRASQPLAQRAPQDEPHVLSGTAAHRLIAVPPFMIPQTLAYSFLQMNYLHHIVKLNAQNIRLWFNERFDELYTQKKREVGLVEERNARLRFIVEELNKLSDLRGSFHHLTIEIKDPVWSQEEQPHKLIKVEPEECEIPPYISPSQIVVVPPDPGPKDDFRERALIEMMDGVLEKLWHEEIKKPIPMPQCMLEKDPEHFNEDDLRQVFDYEAKVEFRNEERNKYRKMLHAEYAKVSQVLNEGIVKFNQRVKETWLMKLRVDSVIGQENLNLMRLRRANLDRVEAAERLEDMRARIARLEGEAERLTREAALVQEQSGECQAAYDALAVKDRLMERTFKNYFTDLSPIVVDQCYKFFKKRPKWHQRATMTPGVLYELAGGILGGARPPLLHPDCVDYFKAVEQLDQPSNMPPVMDEGLWNTTCRLRRAKIENEIRMRAVVLETGYVESASGVWARALQARRAALAAAAQRLLHHREAGERKALNRTVQLVLPAGQVEIVTSGHMEDFEDAALIPREDIEKINNLILKVGELKLRMMRKQMEFRKGILAKEWEHAQMKMKLRHLQQELHSYQRLKIPKELQYYLKNKEKGYTDEQDYVRLEKEMAASKMSFNRMLADHVQRGEELEVKLNRVAMEAAQLDKLIERLNVKVSEKKLHEDPLEPIRIRRQLKNRMDALVARSYLVRQVQANHTAIVLLQTELELLRLKTYPTLASFRTFC